jgi:N-terminal domain of anti-restriction factor ArdC/IrrE N-terminal-like domain
MNGTDALQRLRDGVETLQQSEEWIHWLDIQSRFHHYSWGNGVLIAMQRPDATRVAGFHTWRELGRLVRKGEKGIQILAPMVGKKSKDADPDAPKVCYGFRGVFVFDISQTDGDDLPEITHRLEGEDPDDLFAKLNTFANDRGVSVTLSGDLGAANGLYTFLTKTISIRDDLSRAQMVKTLVHEIAHALLHDEQAAISDRHGCELEAESVAYVVTSALGIDSSEYSFGYIATWAKDSGQFEKSADAHDELDAVEGFKVQGSRFEVQGSRFKV